MKKLIITTVAVAVIALIYLVSNRIPSRADGPSVYDQEEDIQTIWRQSESVPLANGGASQLVEEIVKTHKDTLSDKQMSRLLAKIDQWHEYLHSGSFESLVTFRNPAKYKVNPKTREFVSYKLHGNPDGLDHLSPEDQVRAIQGFAMQLRFVAIRQGTVKLGVREFKTSAEKKLDPFKFYPGGGIRYGKSSSLITEESPDNAFKQGDGIIRAWLQAGYDSTKFGEFIFPVQVSLFWSPKRQDWIAEDCFMSIIPRGELGENENDPTIYF